MENPENFLQSDHPQFAQCDVTKSLEEGIIDKHDANFLMNLLNEYHAGNSEILKEVAIYRTRLSNGLKPGRDRFVLMQELGCKNHPLTGINLTGYDLPEVRLESAVIGGNLDLTGVSTKDQIMLSKAIINGTAIVEDVRAGGPFILLDDVKAKKLYIAGNEMRVSLDNADFEEIDIPHIWEGDRFMTNGLKLKGKKLSEADKNSLLYDITPEAEE